MKIDEAQWQVLCTILENRGYRYFDKMEHNDINELDEYDQKAYLLWETINKRVSGSKKGSVQRFNQDQKEYLRDMISEYQSFNVEEQEEEYSICTALLKAIKV